MIRRLSRLSRLDLKECVSLITAVSLLVLIRLGLRLMPIQTLRRLVATAHRGDGRRELSPPSIERKVWAVSAASRVVPWASTCLTRALAAQVLLGSQPEPTCLQIGVALDEDGRLESHAWLEIGERIIVGGEQDVSKYTLLPPLAT